MAVDLADLEGQHGVRGLAEAVLITLLGVDLDDLEGVTEAFFQGLEAGARRK